MRSKNPPPSYRFPTPHSSTDPRFCSYNTRPANLLSTTLDFWCSHELLGRLLVKYLWVVHCTCRRCTDRAECLQQTAGFLLHSFTCKGCPRIFAQTLKWNFTFSGKVASELRFQAWRINSAGADRHMLDIRKNFRHLSQFFTKKTPLQPVVGISVAPRYCIFLTVLKLKIFACRNNFRM